MKKKILILDDKETIAKVLSIYLMSDYVLVFIENILMLLFWSFIGMQIFNLFKNGKGVRDEA